MDMKYKLIIFDLDGTILDTLDDLADSVNYALAKNGLPEREVDEIRSFVGNGIRLLIERSVQSDTDIRITDRIFSDFKEHYKDNCCNKTKAYDGIISVLRKLIDADIFTAVVSNKADFAVKEIVCRYFDGCFGYFAGEKDGIPRKPSPDSVNEAIRHFGVDKENVLYIGDSEVDVQTAKNAEIDCVCVSWGFRDAQFLKDNDANVIVDDASELEKILMS